jgi:outer membrane lipoprotein-sorting protein
LKKLVLGVLLLTGCPKSNEVPVPPSLVGEVKRALAEREKRLTSFKLVVDSTEGENRAHHEVAFRSPNKSRGHMTSPQDFELAFDGTTLVRLIHSAKKYEVVSLDLPAADRAYFLASQFMPFVPEGYRAPLLPQTGVEARSVQRPGVLEAVELTVKPGEGVTVVYVLRLPAGDFLEKRTTSDGQERVLRMEAEQCDAALKLCVPTKLVERVGETTLGTTEVSGVELNAALPQDTFSPKIPEGWTK